MPSRLQNIISPFWHNSTQMPCMHLIFHCALKKYFQNTAFQYIIFHVWVHSFFCNGICLMKTFIQAQIYGLVWLHDPDILGLSFCHHSGIHAPIDFIWRDFMLTFRKTKPDFHIHIFLFLLCPFLRVSPRHHNLIFFFWYETSGWNSSQTLFCFSLLGRSPFVDLALL